MSETSRSFRGRISFTCGAFDQTARINEAFATETSCWLLPACSIFLSYFNETERERELRSEGHHAANRDPELSVTWSTSETTSFSIYHVVIESCAPLSLSLKARQLPRAGAARDSCARCSTRSREKETPCWSVGCESDGVSG